jgi:hypothetical protein
MKDLAEFTKVFRTAFRGREDVVPRYWQSKDGAKAGYSPICANEWKDGVCNKPCGTCPNTAYVPLSDALLKDHFQGKHILGIYPLLSDGTCHFIAADFDDHNPDGPPRDPLRDATEFYGVCEVQQIPCYLERSKSGKGFHAWIFFATPVPAWKARLVVFAMLREAGVIGENADLSSFDRLFPNQDAPSGKGLGNLIAMPRQGKAAKDGHTLFLDPATGFEQPFKEQLETFRSIQRATEADFDRIIEAWELRRESTPTGSEKESLDPLAVLSGVPEGKRDETLFRYASRLRGKGMSREEAKVLVLQAARSCNPPFPEDQAVVKLESAWRYPAGQKQEDPRGTDDEKEDLSWDLAAELFPRSEFPWEILPAPLTVSLQQLARSCATSSTSLPGCVFAIIASITGRMLAISPKDGWEEPLIVWCADIRPTGSGKTPAANALMKPIHKVQAEAHRKRQAELEHWKGLPRKERDSTPDPPKERAWFVSDLTLEGLRDDLDEHPTGGLMVLQEEISAFISSQNQYRNGRGSDREAWLSLYDGNDARIKRAGKDTFLRGARVNVYGGIQPPVFRRVFSSEDGVFLVDGTSFRFLYTYEDDKHFDLDCASWDETYSKEWEKLIQRAVWWAGKQDAPHRMILNKSAQQRFITWRNEVFSQRYLMPEIFRGFIPKAASYVLRLSGILHFIHRLIEGAEPGSILGIEDIDRGISAVEFYLGQAVDAMRLIANPEHALEVQADPRMKTLAETLQALESQVDNGRLSVSFVRDEFNRRIDRQRRFSEKKQSKAFGLFLRQCGLKVTESVHDANGQRGVKCLLYDENVLHLLHVLKSESQCRSTDSEHEHASSACSASQAETRTPMQNMQNISEHVLSQQSRTTEGFSEHAEHAEEVSLEGKQNEVVRNYLDGLGLGIDGDPEARAACIEAGYLDEAGRMTKAGEDFLWAERS